MSRIKISVITASLNAVHHIERSIESVAAQTYPDIEHVIIDGGSTDGTLEIVDRYRDRIGYFVSEPDTGVYNAMNKGIRAATGDILYFLNADDRFCDHRVVEDVVSVFNEMPHVEIVYGNLIWDISGRMVRKTQPAVVTREYLARTTILHQTVFARRDVFEAIGGFSEKHRIISDYEWMVKALLTDGRSYLYYDRDIAVMGTGGLSWTTDWERERLEVMRNYFGLYEILRYRILPMKKTSAKKTIVKVVKLMRGA
jgi:glycosyltransferase involved in cell wall biosynthesis